jgi:hypothetical protein
MREVFQNYIHYIGWMFDNLNKNNLSRLIELGLINNNPEDEKILFECLLSKRQFKEKEKDGFIFVPSVEQADA